MSSPRAVSGRWSAVSISWAAALLLLLSFAVRVIGLDETPPGWRDDEVIETTVHAQRVLDGELPLFFPEAEGHEPLYHWLSAGTIALWGRGLFQVRLMSAFFGLLALAAHYRLARRLFGPRVALIATFALAFSFWSLMYSRVKIRHISALVFVLLAFDHMMRMVRRGNFEPRRREGHKENTYYGTRNTQHVFRFTDYALLVMPLALSLYTYLAARAAPVVVIVFAAYLAAFHRPVFAARWKLLLAILAATALLALPLFAAMRAQPEAPARLEVVGRPLAALLAGDARPALQGTLDTLAMFAWRGDPEALYNVPGRPVFDWLGAVLFALGLVVCAVRWRDLRHAFVLVWLVVGLSPAFVSTPAASLGHAILALPATYLVLAVGLAELIRFTTQARRHKENQITDDAHLPWRAVPGSRITDYGLRFTLYALLLTLPLLAARDLRDYFVVWPHVPLVRLLYRADLHQAARHLAALGVTDVVLTDRLSLWDARALELDAPLVRARWFNPESALLYPSDRQAPLVIFADPPISAWTLDHLAAVYSPAEATGSFTLWWPIEGMARPAADYSGPEWETGLIFAGYEQPARARPGEPFEVFITWVAGEDFVPPAPRIGNSAAPPPQPFITFVHVLAPDGALVAGYDRFDASAFSLRPGDLIVQRYLPQLPSDLAPGEYQWATGFYDPVTGARFATSDGQSSYIFATVEVGN